MSSRVLVAGRLRSVVDDGRYVGLIAVADTATHPAQEWTELTVREVARRDERDVSNIEVLLDPLDNQTI